MSADVEISVIIPIFNAERYLGKCLDSIINQSFKNLEIICVNDGSTDGSLAILEKYSKKDNRFKIINITNHGQGYARNIGIEKANGKYISFVDADDWIDLDSYEILHDFIVTNKLDVLFFQLINYINSSGNLVETDLYNHVCFKENNLIFTPEEYETLERYTLALFERGTQMAAERGLILVDTKYEFGKHNGEIYLMDEIHTPDSSRYFYSEGYQERFENGEPQKQLSKEFVREWLMANGFQGKEGQKVPEMTPAIVSSISDRYIELYEHITGETFVKADTDQLAERIEKNVTEYLG